MRMFAAARPQPCNPRKSQSSDRGRGASRSPAASPPRSRSPILSPIRGRTPPASPLRGKTPPGSPLHPNFDDIDRQSYVLREAAATAVRYHAFLASTTEQHVTSEDHGNCSSSRGSRSIGSPRRASAVLGAKETKELLHGDAEHEAESLHRPRKTPVADFWHVKSTAETAKEEEAEILRGSAAEESGDHCETQQQQQGEDDQEEEKEEERQQHVSPSASDLEAEQILLECIYDNTLYECPSNNGCRKSCSYSDSQAVDAHANEIVDEDVSLSLTPNPTFQPSRRLSCSPAAEDDDDMAESGASETPSRSLSTLQMERLKLRQKERWGLVSGAEERHLFIGDQGPDRSDDLPAQIPVEFTPGLMPVSALSCPRRTALRSPWSGWSEASDTEDSLRGSDCNPFGDDFSFGKARRVDVGGLGGLGRRLCLVEDAQPAEDNLEDCGLQQHGRQEGPHGTGSAWEVGAELGGVCSEAILERDESPPEPACQPQDCGSLRVQVPTDDSGDDCPIAASCFSPDGGYSCPGRETHLHLGADHPRAVISPQQLSTEETQIVDAFLHTTTAACANPDSYILEAQPSESPGARAVALRATTSASSSWGSSSTLPYGPIPVAANSQRPPGGDVTSSAARLPLPVAQGTRRGRPLVPCRARSSRSMSPSLRAVAAATEASRRFLDGSGSSSSDDDEDSPDESLSMVHAGARAVPRAEVARLLRPALESWRQEASIQRRRDTILTAGFKSEARCRRLETAMSAWSLAVRVAADLQSAAANHAAKAFGHRVIGHWAAVTRQSAEEADRLVEAALVKARSICQGQVFAEWRVLPLLSAADKLWNAKRASAVFEALRDLVSEARQTAGAAALLRRRSLKMAAFSAWAVQFMAWVRHLERQNARAAAFATVVSARRQIGVFRSWLDEVEKARECRAKATALLGRARCRVDLEQWRFAMELQRAERTAVGWRQLRLSGAALNAWILFWARQMAVRVMATHCRLSAGGRALRAWRDVAAGLRADLLARAWGAMVENSERRRRKASRLLMALKRADAALYGRAMDSWLAWWDWRRKKAAAAQAGALVFLRRCLLQWLRSSAEERLERQLVVLRRSRLVSAVFGAWRRRVRIVIGLASLSIARLVAMGSEVLRAWLAAACEEAELRRWLLRSTFMAWEVEAERSADLQERLVVFLTASFEDCLARAFVEWRDAKAVRLVTRQHVREAALLMATRGHLVRSVKAWRDYVEGRRFARTGALSQIIETALASAQQLKLQPGAWFRKSDAGQTLAAILRGWGLRVCTAQRSRAMALELRRRREEGLMTMVLHEWLYFVERNVGILYLQHRLKAIMQEELVKLRSHELAAVGFCDRARRSRGFASWRNALLHKGTIAQVHRDSRLLAWALMNWAHISAANRQVRISQAQLSDVRKKIEALRAAEGTEHVDYPSISLSGIEAVADDSDDCSRAAEDDLEGAARDAEISLRQSISPSNQQVLAGNQVPGLEGQTARMSELLRAYGDRPPSTAGSPQKRLSLRERQCSALLLSDQGHVDLLPSVHTLLGTDRSGHPAKQLLPPPDEAEMSFEHMQHNDRGKNFVSGEEASEPVATKPVNLTPSRTSCPVDGNQRRLSKAVRNMSGSLSDQLARVRRTQASPMDTLTSSGSLYSEQQSECSTVSSQATPSWALPGSGLQGHPLLSREEQGSAAFEDAGGDPFSGASSQIEMTLDDDSVDDICRIRSALALQ